MTPEWIKIIASWVAGFVTACVVQVLALHWQECAQKKLLRKSLYRELVIIYIQLREFLKLESEGPSSKEPNQANLAGFVKAECFGAAKSSPSFWRIDDMFGIVAAHSRLGFLAIRAPHTEQEAHFAVRQALNDFRNMIDHGELSRRDLIRNSEGKLTESELRMQH